VLRAVRVALVPVAEQASIRSLPSFTLRSRRSPVCPFSRTRTSCCAAFAPGPFLRSIQRTARESALLARPELRPKPLSFHGFVGCPVRVEAGFTAGDGVTPHDVIAGIAPPFRRRSGRVFLLEELPPADEFEPAKLPALPPLEWAKDVGADPFATRIRYCDLQAQFGGVVELTS
jgi:hypothetical protein